MSEREQDLEIHRILVALDASPHSLSALEAATEMAVRLRAELLGLFVEDANVRRLADLPFAQEVGLLSATPRRLDVGDLSRQLRAQARQMRRYFQAMTERAGVPRSFREARGRVTSEVLKAASDADVVILGKGAWSPVETGRLGPAVRRVLSQVGASAMVLQAGARLELPLLVVYDGSVLAHKALSAAAALAKEENGGRMTVLLLADEAAGEQRLQAQAETWLEGREVDTSYQMLRESSVARLAYLVAQGEYGTLVLPARSPVMQDEAVLDFLDEIKIPVLLVKQAV
jgi:nucleotide-binding universal stress UspA family protein